MLTVTLPREWLTFSNRAERGLPRAGEERLIDGWHFAIDTVARRRVGRVTSSPVLAAPFPGADGSALP